MEGWIKLHRGLLDWEWYDEPNVFRLFMHCLLKANHSDKTWRGIKVKRGEFITSLKNLSEETKLSVQQVRTSLKKLTNEITVKSNTQYTVIQVVKYNEYQSDNKENNKRVTNEQQTDNKQITTTKNDNNDNNENNTCLTFDQFWDMYDKKVGDKDKLRKKYAKVSEEDREKIKNTLPSYVQSTEKDNKQFRKNVNTYLNNKSWNDEIIANKNNNVEVQPVTKAKSYEEYMEHNKRTNTQACQD